MQRFHKCNRLLANAKNILKELKQGTVGMAKIAKDLGLNRESLYKSLSRGYGRKGLYPMMKCAGWAGNGGAWTDAW
jgi:DNA-binding phage protein